MLKRRGPASGDGKQTGAHRTWLSPDGMDKAAITTPRRAMIAFLFGQLRLRLRGMSFRTTPEAQVPIADLRRIDTCWAAASGLAPISW